MDELIKLLNEGLEITNEDYRPETLSWRARVEQILNQN